MTEEKKPWVLPQDWQFTLWERPKGVSVGDWQLVIIHSQDFTCHIRDLLSRLQPKLEFVVCRPGHLPNQGVR